MSLNIQLGNMRKPQDFTIYPMGKEDKRIYLQSDHRFLILDPETGKGMLSKQIANYPMALHCSKALGAMEVELSADQLAEVKLQIIGRGRTLDVGGHGAVLADNSGLQNLKL